MTQEERDRLVTLKKAKQKKITQKQAAKELDVSPRQVGRLLAALKQKGDKAAIHGLKGKQSNRRICEATKERVIAILSKPVYEGFGPTLAAEYLEKKHEIEFSKETVRKWMKEAGLWRAKKKKVEKPHPRRERRSCFGELVQWDTSPHEWLEGRGEELKLVAMIDDATSRLLARFVRHDSTQENMELLWTYLEKNGRPRAFYTDKASLFHTTEKRKRDEPGVDKDPVEMPPTQIGRALQELGIVWIAAHSAQAKGRVERHFETAQDRLVKGLRVVGAKTLEEANEYLENEYLPWWHETRIVEPARDEDVHQALSPGTNLAGILSHVETRTVDNGYTLRVGGKRYQVARDQITTGMRKAKVRVEWRLDGSLAVRYQERYLNVELCVEPSRPPQPENKPKPAQRKPKKRSDWDKNFELKKAPPLWKVAQSSGYRRTTD
ncbi:MAG: ISNCY family transposase [Nitrospira sp. CR2.1]|nr:ISNCY family transposase [Nitrospira sp. CR2.1]